MKRGVSGSIYCYTHATRCPHTLLQPAWFPLHTYFLYFPSKIKNCHECFCTVCLPAFLAQAPASISVTLGTTFSGFSNEFCRQG